MDKVGALAVRERRPAGRKLWHDIQITERLCGGEGCRDEEEEVYVKFVVMADPQLGFLHNNTDWSEEAARLRLVLDHALKEHKPTFVIIVGDMAQKFPEQENQEIRVQQVEEFISTVQRVAAQHAHTDILTVCGNHDVGNRPSTDTVERHEQVFGDSYYTFRCGADMLGVVLNTCLMFDDMNVLQEQQDQMVWLERILEENREMKHKIVFGHHPFFVQAVDEPDELGDTFVPFVNKLVPLSHFHIPLARRMPLLNLLERYGVRYSFHGHTHYNKIVRSGSFEQVITTATGVQLGNDKPGYRVVRIYKDGRIDTTEFVTVLPHVEY
eukprot:GHVQ01022827.1.p1 GENE.GHVQ01022827.1~~GHVQ01022827.1.p1  ORF type:complete len:325 (+),score=48.63 GHVQ01022827.1:93-1067(+)